MSALLRHYEEGFWLVALAILSLPGVHQLCEALGIMRFAEARAASTAMCGPYHAHDVALSLLRMVSNNVGHIACLSAQHSQLRHIVFGGSFIRDHPYTISTISSAVRFFSRGAVQPLFLRHDGFVGAIGAHLSGNPLAGSADKMEPYAAPPPPPHGTAHGVDAPQFAAPQSAIAPQSAAQSPAAQPPAAPHSAAAPHFAAPHASPPLQAHTASLSPPPAPASWPAPEPPFAGPATIAAAEAEAGYYPT